MGILILIIILFVMFCRLDYVLCQINNNLENKPKE